MAHEGIADFRSDTVLNVGQWYYFTYTYEGSTGESRLYLDGALDAGPFDENMSTYFTADGQLRIGSHPGFGTGNSYANVFVDSLVVYDRALTDGEIAILSGRRDGHRWVAVRDSGPGIADDVRDAIFTPFFSSKRDGRGVGLTLTREILTRHGLEFSLDNHPEGGAEFRIEWTVP